MIEQKEIPKHWKLKKLGQLLEFVTGGDWGKEESFSDENYSVAYCIRGSEIKRWDEEKGRTASLRKIKKTSIESRKLKAGDILVEISGGGPEQPVGRTVLIDKSVLSFEPRVPKICTNFLRLIRPVKEIDSNFLNLFLKLFYYSGKIVDYQGGSNNLRNLKFPEFVKINIPLPPLPEQQAIVSKIEELLSKLENGKQQLQTAQQQLKTYRQSLLKWAFEGRLTNKNVNGELPKGWKKVSLNEVAFINPKIPNTENISDDLEVQFVPMKLVEELVGKFHLTETRKYSEVKRNSYTPFINDDVIFAKVTPCMENGKITVVNNLKNKIGFGSSEFHVIRPTENILSKYIFYFVVQDRFRNEAASEMTGAVGLRRVPKQFIEKHLIPLPPLKEQQRIVDELESKLTVCDKIVETITNSLQQAEMLKQSILKKAFEGKLLTVAKQREAKVIPLYKPRNEYFYQMQVLGLIAKASKEKQIQHGEMTIAKYAYLADKIYNIPTFYEFQRCHLGPYPPVMKKALNNKKFFKIEEHNIEVKNENTLFKYSNPYKEKINEAVNDLAEIFSKYEGKARSHKTEMLATVCKVVEDIQATELKAVRQSMKEWKIKLRTTHFKNKAEKFTEAETKKCLLFVSKKGWDKKLINRR